MRHTNSSLIATAALAAVLATLAGCGGHYRIVDPAHGRIYYTSSINRGRCCSVRFTDLRTCKQYILHNPVVERLPRGEPCDGCHCR